MINARISFFSLTNYEEKITLCRVKREEEKEKEGLTLVFV